MADHQPGLRRPRLIGVEHGPVVVDQALEDQVRRDLVLDPGPHLVGVDERDARAPAARPRAEHEPRLVVERVGALHAPVHAEVAAEVVTVDGRDRAAHMLRRKDVTEPGEVGEALVEHLVAEAAGAVLVAALVDLVKRYMLYWYERRQMVWFFDQLTWVHAVEEAKRRE